MAPTLAMMTYYAVCDANGPISVKLEGHSKNEALTSWKAMNARDAIDSACTDLEDALGFDGTNMSESEFTMAAQDKGATPVEPLGEIDQHGRSVAGDWYLWSVYK